MLGDRETETAMVGDKTTIGDLEIEVVGGQHAVIHDRIPRIGNVGYVITEDGGPTIFHPGDSYATVPSGIDVLALPLNAPWATVAMTVDFANAVRAALMIPIHDANLGDKGRPTYLRISRGLLDAEIVLEDPALGEPHRL
jgi:L-ascorbate metabolism protein UlaG (beta-lactamase superfamily)